MFENYPDMTRENLTPEIKDELRQIIPKCEICHKKRSEDVHHITEVHTANGSSDLNRVGNLLVVCEDCHINWLHGDDAITKTRQREIAGKRSDSVRSRVNSVLRTRDLAVRDDSSALLWLGAGVVCAIGLYALYKRWETTNNETRLHNIV